MQYNTIQYNTIQYNTIQYNTTQHRIEISKVIPDEKSQNEKKLMNRIESTKFEVHVITNIRNS